MCSCDEIYPQRHADGVVSVGFAEVDASEACLNVSDHTLIIQFSYISTTTFLLFSDHLSVAGFKEMNGRWFAGKKLIAERWDGVTKYAIEETEEEKEARLKNWDDYLDQNEEKD